MSACLLTHSWARRRCQVWDVPAAWSLRDAATVPVAYLTAYYSLVMRGGLVPAHRVLVHSGTGAVGLAAIRIALNRGCEARRAARPRDALFVCCCVPCLSGAELRC
jgi:NADPH:quinone reductase-like Zn-dependent oxidoreductase